jgi:hypothetical protein
MSSFTGPLSGGPGTSGSPIRTGLSPAAIGGITGGLLGSAFLVCLVVILYMVAGRKKLNAMVMPNVPRTRIGHKPEGSTGVGGRLQYPEVNEVRESESS